MGTSQEVIVDDVVLGWEPNALVENRRHARSSDLLLSKLISGQVAVEDIETRTEG
jgi:hypothetical protein